MKLLSTKEIAEILGLTRKTIYMWKWRKKNLPFIKVGKSVRVRKEDLAAFITKNTRNPTKEKAEEK